MDRIKSILVAVDFSPCAREALGQSLRLGERHRASVAALHVAWVPEFVPVPPAILPFSVPTANEFISEAQRQWEPFFASAAGRGAAPIPLTVEVGSPADRILNHVQIHRPDLLVLGAHGPHDASRGIGPVAATCMQRAGTKVLVVREGHRGPFRSVVVGIDFSETSRAALEQGVRVAATDDAALHIVHVYDDPWRGLANPLELTKAIPDFKIQYRSAIEERARAFCEPMGHEINALKATFHCIESERRGGHGQAIVDFIKKGGGSTPVDLVVLGTRARWNLRDFVWGSTAERVARGAPCSILAVNPPEGASEPAPTTVPTRPPS